MTISLLKRLTEYSRTHIPMHMPGHKRNAAFLADALPYDIDITEIDGFDNLHDMQGILKETAELAASLYGCKQAFPLVGGSTCGILAAMYALCPRGSHVLMSRGSHKSVYNGVEVLELIPHYLLAESDENGISQKISPAHVEQMLTNQPVSLVILTSPSYEGVVQNIEDIAHICHRHGALLLVDSAHGAHTGFIDFFPQNAVSCGADMVVMSLHKTMPALTQTALLNICSDRISPQAIQHALSIFETSSPSYILLASIDRCLRFTKEQKNAIFSKYADNLAAFYRKTSNLRALCVLHYDDAGKIIISTRNAMLSGVELAELLRHHYHIETEMATQQYVLAMTSICDDAASLNALADALISIDDQTAMTPQKKTGYSAVLPTQRYTPAEAKHLQGNLSSLSGSVGRIVLETVWAYPPGIPLIVPGEEIPEGFQDTISNMLHAGIELKSTTGHIKEEMIYAR